VDTNNTTVALVYNAFPNENVQ